MESQTRFLNLGTPEKPFELLSGERTYDTNAGQVLLQHGRQPAFGLVHLFEQVADFAKKQDREQDDQRPES